MNMRNVNIVARYESKLLRRDIVFLGFVVIALVGISLWQMIKQGRVNVFWYKVALPSSFPFFIIYNIPHKQMIPFSSGHAPLPYYFARFSIK